MIGNGSTSVTITTTMKAAGMVTCSVLLFSTLPLFIALLGIDSPFLFTAAWKIGITVILAAVLATFYPRFFTDKEVWKLAWNRCLSWSMLCWTVSQLEYALFAWSAGFIAVSVTTVIYQIWPVLLVAFTGWLFRHEARYRKVGLVAYTSFILAVFGVTVVVMSQSGTWDAIIGDDGLFPTLDLKFALGILLALGAAGLSAMSAVGFKWATDFAKELPDIPSHSKTSREVFGISVGLVFASFASAPFWALIGFSRNETTEPTVLTMSLILIPLVDAIATISWRRGNLITDWLGINVIFYFTPLLSLSVLLWFGQVGDVNLLLLFIGAVIIVIANMFVFSYNRSVAESQRATSQEIADVDDLVAAGESDTLEFKSSLRTNLHTQKSDQRMELAALKTLAAFLNTNGGALVVGVADDHKPVGIDVDNFQSEDRMGLHLRNIVNSRMGPLAMSCIRPSFHDFEGERVMVVRCEPSSHPVYVDEGNEGEKFYIRTGPSITELSISDSFRYISNRFLH